MMINRWSTITYEVGANPKIGDVARGCDVGRKSNELVVRVACEDCGKERWNKYYQLNNYCFSCSQKRRYKRGYKRIPITYVNGNEPKAGDVATGKDITKNTKYKYSWYVCPNCGKGRWKSLANRTHNNGRLCISCSTKKHNIEALLHGEKFRWHGGRMVNQTGYIFIKVFKGDPYYPMADKNRYISEHRLVMAKYLGRCLTKKEVVHHRNGNRSDNSIENLELNSCVGEHSKEHSKGYSDGFEKGYKDGLNKKVKELEDEIAYYKLILFDNKEKENVV